MRASILNNHILPAAAAVESLTSVGVLGELSLDEVELEDEAAEPRQNWGRKSIWFSNWVKKSKLHKGRSFP